MPTLDAGSSKQAYELFAPAYEDFNRNYMYERWTGRLLAAAEGAGLEGNRLLDVACGTGLSFVTMLARGWRVTGCDISPAMLEIARSKVGDDVELVTADMRELPELGQFDLVWAVNDPINYLLSVEELEATLAGMRRNLAPDGVLLFDVNTLTTFRTFWSRETVIEGEERRLTWTGRGTREATMEGSVYEARFEVEGDPKSAHVHRQRHFPEAEVLACIETAGLRCAGVHGERDGDLHEGFDEEADTKVVYLCRHAG
jgi:SAM-dependent methyltransferase